MAGLDQQYKVAEAFITSNRFPDKEFDISKKIYEIVLYENLEVAWLTGELVVGDDVGLFSEMEFKSTEYITIRLSGTVPNSPPIIDKTFIMNNLRKQANVNDKTAVYLFDLIEPHAYLNALKPFSRAYTGSMEKIITQILNSQLKKTVDLSYLTRETVAQGITRFIVPYLTPLEACEYLVDRSTSVNGSPCFLYASVHDDNLRLGDLDTMLLQKPFNVKVPYLYSQSAAQSSSDLDQASQSTQVIGLTLNNTKNSLSDIENGILGSLYTDTDITTGVSSRAHVSVKKILNNFFQREVLPKNSEQNIFDENQKFEEKDVDEFNSVYWHQVSSSNVYGGGISSYSDGGQLKVSANILRNILLSNMINVSVSGVAFMLSKATIGDKVSINFLSSKEDALEIYDQEMSGDYLVYGAKHIFRDTSHVVNLDITKLVNQRVPGTAFDVDTGGF